MNAYARARLKHTLDMCFTALKKLEHCLSPVIFSTFQVYDPATIPVNAAMNDTSPSALGIRIRIIYMAWHG